MMNRQQKRPVDETWVNSHDGKEKTKTSQWMGQKVEFKNHQDKVHG